MAAAQNPLEAFIWGAGGSKKTPEEIARDKEIAAELLMKAGNTSPVEHWTQGAARVADALSGVIKQKRAERAGVENDTYNQGILSELFKGGSTPAATAGLPASGASAEIASSSPVQPINMSGNEIYSQFMDTVKGSVQNPYALAAIAATGKAESGFSPQNATRTWSDPSQSGQPGTAGGIMSWRGPRYNALAATGDLSPSGQAKFFLQEDPQLIASLNKAGSVEEAQRLMNRAWAFAGYDQPGGEAARRLQAANGFLPTFQGSAQPTEVASLDPSAGMAAPTAAVTVAEPEPVAMGTPLPDQSFDDRFGPTPLPVDAVQGREGLSAALTEAAPEDIPQPANIPLPVAADRAGLSVQAPAQQPTAVQQVAQALPSAGQAQQAVPGMSEALLRAISDPRATPQTRAVVQALMQQEQAKQAQAAEQQQWMARQQYEQQAKTNDPAYRMGLEKSQLEIENLRNPRLTPGDKLAREKFDLERGQQGKTADINEYEYAKQRGYEGSFVDFQLAQKKASASSTTINNGEGDKFYENLDKKNAESFAALSESGVGGRSRLAQLGQLETLLSQSPSGAEANVKLWLGDMGINTDGLDGLQATRALIEKMVPEQRAPGSGPMSDADIGMYRRSLASTINQPGGNALILGTAKAIADYDIKMGEIADQVADRVISPADGRKKIRELENPLSGYSEKLKALRGAEDPNVIPTDLPNVIIRRKSDRATDMPNATIGKTAR